MKPLTQQIDKQQTRIAVAEHMQSLSMVKYLVKVEEGYFKSSSVVAMPDGTPIGNDARLVGEIDRVDTKNSRIVEYVETIMLAINELSSYDRKLILSKYFYLLDEEEMKELFGTGSKKLRNDISSAELSLAFRLECVVFQE